MKKLFAKYVMLLFCITFFISNPVLSKQNDTTPNNITRDIQQALRYHDSGKYMQQVEQTTQKATTWFLKRIQKRSLSQKKLAVVFDIDETLLSNYSILKTYFQNFIPALVALHNGDNFIIRYKADMQPQPILPMQKLYNLIKQHNVAIFLITGNHQQGKKYTVHQLHHIGYTGWTGIFFSPNHYHAASAAPYKTAVRKKITAQGYDIILSMGDQYSDMKGGYAEKFFKLPNPYYFIP